MNNKYLLVDKEVLPTSYQLVFKTKELIEANNISVSEACRLTGISRSTFYKYSDNILPPPNKVGKRACFLVQVDNEKGALSSVLNKIADYNCNILTINQDTPITPYAYITIMIDTLYLQITISKLVEEIKLLPKTKNITIIAIE